MIGLKQNNTKIVFKLKIFLIEKRILDKEKQLPDIERS